MLMEIPFAMPAVSSNVLVRSFIRDVYTTPVFTIILLHTCLRVRGGAYWACVLISQSLHIAVCAV